MTPDAIRRLYNYTYWAFERMWDCIIQLTDEQFAQHIDYSIGSIRNHIVHLMSGTQRWIKRIQGAEIPSHLSFDNYTTREATKIKWDEMKADVLDYLQSLNQEQLDEIVHWEIPTRGMSYNNRRWELLMHVANHATDHRAQMLAMLHHHFGVMTVEHDMIIFLLGAESSA